MNVPWNAQKFKCKQDMLTWFAQGSLVYSMLGQEATQGTNHVVLSHQLNMIESCSYSTMTYNRVIMVLFWPPKREDKNLENGQWYYTVKPEAKQFASTCSHLYKWQLLSQEKTLWFSRSKFEDDAGRHWKLKQISGNDSIYIHEHTGTCIEPMEM